MPKKKPTARQRDIERLTKDYQSSLASLDPEYQSAFGEKTKALSQFESKNQEYQKKLEAFKKTLEQYKANPFTNVSYRKLNVPTGGTAKDPSKNWLYNALYIVPELTTRDAYTPYTLQEKGYVVEGSGETLSSIRKKSPLPTFSEKPPVALDTTESDTDLQSLEEKRKTLGEGFEREKAERRASQLRVVSQRSRERPMLSKGTSLNG